MKRVLSILAFALISNLVHTQSLQPIDAGDGRFTQFTFEQGKPNLESRATGTYYLDYVEFDRTFLSNTINNGVYGNLCFTKTDTSYGNIPFVAEYYDSLVLSTNFVTWSSMSWQNVVSLTVDSVFVRLNVDNSTATPNYLKMKIVDPVTTTNVTGDWRNFNVTPIWQDSLMTTTDIGVHSPGTISFVNVGFAVGVNISGPFGIMFEFSGDVQDTCRLIWSYPTNGVPCSNGSVSSPNTTPQKWDLYPTSYYNICTGGTGSNQNVSVAFPQITGAEGYAFYVDCANPSTPYVGDNVANGFDGNKNQFQHWNMWALVTITDNIGIEEQNEKGIKVFAYPNPAADILNINFTLLNDAENIDIVITDLSGRSMMKKNIGAYAAGKGSVVIPIDIPAGIYTYSLYADGVVVTRKFIMGK